VSRISKAVREEAIEALLCCADVRNVGVMSYLDETFDEPAYLKPGFHLASDAYRAVERVLPDDGSSGARGYVRGLLNAAGLLLDGWNPGDPVVRR
jgi:hypothetical protein